MRQKASQIAGDVIHINVPSRSRSSNLLERKRRKKGREIERERKREREIGVRVECVRSAMAGPVVSELLEQLWSMVEPGKSSKGVKKEASRLSNTLVALQSALMDAEKIGVHLESVRTWLCKVDDVCYELDSVLDEWKTAELRSKIENEKSKIGFLTNKVRFCMPIPLFCFPRAYSRQVDRRGVASKFKEFYLNLANIASAIDVFLLKSTRSFEMEAKITTHFLDFYQVYGRDEEKDTIINMFSGKGETQVIPVVGMVGCGKTTLAKLVFNDEKVKAHFDLRIWVHVGYEFDSLEVAKKIIAAIGGHDAPTFLALENLSRYISKSLRGKRFLIVLDDIWTEDETKWLQLKGSLRPGAVGSGILVTTQKEQVAIMMRAQTKMIRLGLLSEEHCWSIFCDQAFSGRVREECTHLEEIGRKIVKRCNGLPLAIKTLGSLLKYKQSKQEWMDVLHNELWKLRGVDCKLFSPFFLSYRDLPTLQKHCLLYCTIFPRNYEIDRADLVELWMSQGYWNVNKNFEMGENCFKSLAMRSFFHDVEKNYDGKIEKFKIHASVQEFSRLVCQGSDVAYHRNLSSSSAARIPRSRLEKLRTVFLLDSKTSAPLDLDLFSNLKHVRMLSLRQTGISELPSGIGKLIHLRYLNLSHNEFLKELPIGLCNLLNLQTLKLNYCNGLERLPEGMEKLVNLLHLLVEGCSLLSHLPKGIQSLTRLRRLDMFVAPYDYCKKDGVMTLASLNELKLLQGSLRINRIGNVVDAGDAKKAQLRDRQDLVDLKLNFSHPNGPQRTNVESALLLEALQPPRNLLSLEIEEYCGETFPSWMVRLANLKRLSLVRCHNCEFLPPLGNLPSLKSLHIEDMSKVEKVGLEFLGMKTGSDTSEIQSCLISFPKLKDFSLKGLCRLKEWLGLGSILSEEGDSKFLIMPSLDFLEVSNCENLKALPGFLKRIQLKTLTINNCPILEKHCREGVREDSLKISYIPNILVNHFGPKLSSIEESEVKMTKAAVANNE